MSWLSEDHVAHSVLDSLTASICVIDNTGNILAENVAWTQFSLGNGGATSYVGSNYVDLCARASAGGSETANRMGIAIGQVLAGKLERFQTEYPCHSPGAQRWFLARATPLRSASGGIVGATISHQDVTEKKLLELKLRGFAETDDLTGLVNRRSIVDHLGKAISGSATDRTIALFLLDLDNFKDVNDTFGHDAGDYVIGQVAARLSTLTFEHPSAVVARMGGDEFALFVEIKQPWSAVPIAEKILALLDEPHMVHGEHVQCFASIGIAFFPTDASTPQSLLKAADLALYKSKEVDRNRYVYFTENLLDAAEQRKSLFVQGRSGVLCNEFETYFQPIVRLKDKSLSGLEALIRWNHPERGLLTPGQFLPLLKDWAMGEALSQLVLLQVIRLLSEWPGIRTSVNLTSGQLRNANFVDFLSRETAAHAVAADQLKLEITEDVVLGENSKDLGTVLGRLRDAGFKISLDDFGTGYASLSHLSKFPLDEIKIDMSFVKELDTSRDARSVVRAITHLAHELGLGVVAEGIENAEIEGIVTALGCDHGQGYLFGKPQPASAIPAIINSWPYSSRALSAFPGLNLMSNSR